MTPTAQYVAATLASVPASGPVTQIVAVVEMFGVPSPRLRGPAITITNPVGSTYVWRGALCPMAVFVITGGDVSVLWAWNATAAAYTRELTFGPTNGAGWELQGAVASVNGEGSYNNDACLMTTAWHHPASLSFQVQMHSMLSHEQYVSWQINGGVRAVTAVAMHYEYAAVSMDASDTLSATSPISIALFSIYSPSGPIATYSTLTNNAVGIDLIVIPAIIPWPAPDQPSQPANTNGLDQIYVASGDESTAVLLYTTVPSHWANNATL